MQSDTSEPSRSQVPPGPQVPSVPPKATGAVATPLSALTAQFRSQLKECRTRQQISAAILQAVAKHLNATIVRVDLREGSATKSEIVNHRSMSTDSAQKFSDKWLSPLSLEVQTDQVHAVKFKSLQRETQILFVASAAIMDHQTNLAEGAVSVMITGRPQNTDLTITQLDALASIASLRLAELAPTVATAPVAEAALLAASTNTLPDPQALGKVATNSSPREFAFSLVNSLANQLGAEQVGFGMNESSRIRVLAISGLPDFKAASPGVAVMRQAMEECLDHGSLVLQQTGTIGPDGTQFAIHRQWSAESGGACLCSIPVKDNDSVVGVVSIRRSAHRPFTKEEVGGLMQMLQNYGSALRVLEKATQSFQKQLRMAMKESLGRWFGTKSMGRKVALASFALASIWFVFGTITYKPMCKANVVAENMVQMTAPLAGRLMAVHVQPGQEVRAGQLLVEFDTTDLALQLQGLEREIASSELDVRRAIDARDTSAAALHKARVGVLITQAAAIQEHIERARMIAPEDGTIVRADLEKRVGQVFSSGEAVIEFASQGGWVLEIQIPDDIGTLVQPKQSGTFAAASYSSHSMPFNIVSVDGTTQVLGGANVFIARAPLAERPDWMKSGMEGTARVTTVSKPVWWVVLHRVVDWCRLSFWI